RHTGVTFSVIDRGVIATDTPAILRRLEENLATYKPDMVVAMMGFNDRRIVYYDDIPEADTLLFKYCKTYRLLRLLYNRLVKKALHAPEPQDGQEPGRLRVQDAQRKKDIELGRLYRSQNQLSQAESSFKEAIETAPQSSGAYIELGWVYRTQGKLSQAEAAFKKAAELESQNDHTYDGRAYEALAILYGIMDKPELARAYIEKADRMRSKKSNPITAQNYQRLKETLDRQGIRLVCVQYPMRSIGPLKKMFRGEEGNIIFIDNEKLFKDAVHGENYAAYFQDAFGGDFGHCTDKGNRLLAANIADAIVREVLHK
ncbi:MAG TPA: tetratricopeptide repeat protein, partial [Patescibacteria group bacterium]|nr:tetratricopeptide repeat protein [Patescibacteria group bacterium]